MTAASSIKTPIMTLPLKQGLGMPQAAELTTRLRHICLAEVDRRACKLGRRGSVQVAGQHSLFLARSFLNTVCTTQHWGVCRSPTHRWQFQVLSSSGLGGPRTKDPARPCPRNTRAAMLPQGSLSAAQMRNPHVLPQVLEGVTLSEQPWTPSNATSLGFARVYKVMLHFQEPSKYPPEVGLDWQAVKLAFSRTFIGALTVSRQ